MGFRSEAREIIGAAEESLRKLMAEALSDKQYKEVAALAPLADAVAVLLNSADIGGEAPLATNVERPTAIGKVELLKRPKDYPRFEREADKLIKVGWSRREGRSYEHRAPWQVVMLIGETIAQNSSPSIFAIDQLGPLALEDYEVPSYQVYLILAWFRSIGAVERRGKNRYVAKRECLTSEELKRQWDSLQPR